MPTATYIALANTTLSSATGSVTFSSIPSTYRDLVIVGTNLLRADGGIGTRAIGLRINDDTGQNYPWVNLGASGNGNQSSATGSTTGYMSDAGGVIIDWGPTMFTINIMDYATTDKQKTGLVRHNNWGSRTRATAFRWNNTAPINKLQILVYDANTAAISGTFAANASFALYGIVS